MVPEAWPAADDLALTPDQWERVTELFEGALERPASHRADYVSHASGGDALLSHEVLSLLEAHDTAGGPVDGLMRTLTDAAEEPAVEGRRIGPYSLVREIGRGGMGLVYLARRADGQYERLVALKIARSSMPDRATRDSFRRERDILAGLSHPNIAALYDGGMTPDGHPYFTMEYVEGQAIDAHCNERRLDLTARLRLFLDVCHAVTAAHRALVVHRDLKPRNVSVTADGHVKLLDFGIARLLDPDGGRADAPTAADARVMTPEYASPEQVSGGRISTATDVYALGLLLYELVCGRRAHRFDSTAMADIQRVVVHDDPVRPSDAVGGVGAPDEASPEAIARTRGTTPARLARQLRGDLDRIVGMALRKEPADRYASAALLADDVERYLTGRPVLARRPSAGYRLRKFVGRHRMAMAGGVFVVATLAGYVGLALEHAVEVRQAAGRAQAEAMKAQEVADFLVGLFEASDPDLAQGDQVTGRELLERGLRRADLLAEQPAVQAQLLHAIGRVYFSLGQIGAARATVERSLAVSRTALGDEHLDVARGYRTLGVVMRGAGDMQTAEQLLRRALSIDRKLAGGSSTEAASDLFELGYTLLQLGRVDEGERLLRESLALRRARFGEAHVAVAESLSGMAFARGRQGHPRDAAALYREALLVRTRALGPRHPEVARAHQNLAVMLVELGEYAEAEAHLAEALALYRAVYGDAHPSIGVTLNNLGLLMSEKRDFARAESLFRESAAMQTRLRGAEHPSTLRATSNLASALMNTNKLAESEALYRAILAVGQRSGTSGGGTPQSNLAEVLRRRGRLYEAERHAREALAFRRRGGSRTLDEAATLAGLGRILTDRRAFDEARAVLSASLDIRRERLGDRHPSTVRVRGFLAELEARQRAAPASR
jgi:serine/threonine-protein kinase